MKSRYLSFVAGLVALALGAGCGHVDVAAEGFQNRVLTGTLVTGVPLPAGAEVMVRLIAPAGADRTQPTGGDIPVTRQATLVTDRILGEQVQKLATPAAESVPFRLEYVAEDALLRRGVSLEARVYFSDRVRFRTINAHVVTLTSAPFPQRVVLQAASR